MFKENSRLLADRLASEKDAVVRDTITRYLGRSDWTLDEIRERGYVQMLAGIEQLCIDDIPVVEFYPPEYDMDDRTVRISRNYRILVPPNSNSTQVHTSPIPMGE